MKAYSSARDEYEGNSGVFLDANENALGSASLQLYNRYPDPHHRALKSRWSELKGVSPEQVFFGNGSDEPIDLLIRLFCEPKQDYIITMPPTYGMYEVSAGINAVANKLVPLTRDFQIDLETLRSGWDENAKMLFLCTPNNPSGNLLDTASIVEVLESFPGMVVVDEAYIDFSPQPGWLGQLSRYRNLVILQTLSKAWGMAGVRVGVAMADPYVIAMLERIKPPYNISQPNQRLALEALQNEEKKQRHVAEILHEKQRLEEELHQLPVVKKIHPSHANFLLVEFADSKGVFTYLIKNEVIVRDRSRQLHCDHCLRITVGTHAENERLLALLRQYS